MHITRRRLLAAAGSAALAPAVVRAADQPVMSSTVVDWTALTATTTAVGAVRQVFKAPTATLTELECHVTTLNPGLSSHAPHRHPNEEISSCNREWSKSSRKGRKRASDRAP